jgi:hypothetical protein
MKKMLVVAILLAALTGAAWAQVIDFGVLETSFQGFADGVANSLPISASIGLNWSHAYIGQFPHFGVGVTVGGMFLPYETIEPIISELGVGTTVPQQLQTYGIPFPTIAAGARLGGFGLPFDMGFKFAIIPEEAKELFSPDITADFFLIGGDVRLPVVKGKGLIPTLSIGGGYTFIRGRIGITDVSSTETINITDMMTGAGVTGPGMDTLVFTDPDLVFTWDTHTIEAKAQASWNALIFTPSIGIGAAYGISNAGGGLSSTMEYYEDGSAIPTSDLTNLQTAFAYYGYPTPSASGFEVVSDANGWSFWVFGGTAINLFFVKIDLSAMYNFLNGDYGGSVNVRVQL